MWMLLCRLYHMRKLHLFILCREKSSYFRKLHTPLDCCVKSHGCHLSPNKIEHRTFESVFGLSVCAFDCLWEGFPVRLRKGRIQSGPEKSSGTNSTVASLATSPLILSLSALSRAKEIKVLLAACVCVILFSFSLIPAALLFQTTSLITHNTPTLPRLIIFHERARL
jgi:hypothetical protein